MKIAVVKYDTRENDENVNLANKIDENYCKLQNYDYIFDLYKPNEMNYDWEEFINDEKDLFFSKICYHKLELIEKYINNDYDYVVMIDSDACINNPFIRIQDLIDNEHDFFISQDCQMAAWCGHLIPIGDTIREYGEKRGTYYSPIPYETIKNDIIVYGRSVYDHLNYIVTNPNGINTGFIIIKSSDIMKDFIKNCKKYFILFQDAFHDQGCIGFLLNHRKYKNTFKILSIDLQGNPFITDAYLFKYDEDKTFICHFYGHSSEKEKVKGFLNQVQHNKWWSKLYI